MRSAIQVSDTRSSDKFTIKAIFWAYDSTLHDPHIVQELSKILLLPQDIEEWKDKSMEEVVSGLFLSIISVSALTQSSSSISQVTCF